MPQKSNQHTKSLTTHKTVGDSVFQTKDTHPSLFENHLLKPQTIDYQIHKTNHDFWVAGLLLLIYTLFVWLYVSNRKKLNQLVKAFYLNRPGDHLSKDDLAIGNRVAVFLSIFFIVNSTLFGVQVISHYKLSPLITHNTSIFAILIGLSIVFMYCFKFLIIKTVGNIFNTPKESSEYSMLVFLFCNTLGLFMLPVVLGLSFIKQVDSQIFIYVGFILIGGFITIRTLRGLFIGMNSSRVSKFYLFVYLCVLELLPLVILAKLFFFRTEN